MDSSFFATGRATREMNAAQNVKFTTIPEMRDVLLKTREAKLMHTVGRSSEKVYFANLVDIREKLRNLDLKYFKKKHFFPKFSLSIHICHLKRRQENKVLHK